MNPRMIRRAIDRHRYMLDDRGYELFLQELDRVPDVWRVTQSGLADWWLRRNSTVLSCTVGPSALVIDCPLESAAVRWKDDLHVLPLLIPRENGEETEVSTPRIATAPDVAPVLEELARHLGFGHVEIVVADDDALGDRAAAALDGFTARCFEQKCYPEADLTIVTELLREATRRAGWPDVRLSPLPSRDGRPYRAAFSPRFDVDKAIVNIPRIVAMQDRHDVVGTFYLRPVGIFYGRRAIRTWGSRSGRNELALHGEFVTTAEHRSVDEGEAARFEKDCLEQFLGREVSGVCIHGGELRTNLSTHTAEAVEAAGFRYITTSYERPYTLPFFMPRRGASGFRRTLTMLRHQDDVTVPCTPDFPEEFARRFRRDLDTALEQTGVFIPTMHPLYFGLGNYLRYPSNLARIVGFVPVFLARAAKMRSGSVYVNQDIRGEGAEGC